MTRSPEDRVGRYFRLDYPARGTVLDRIGFRASHDGTVAFVISLDLPLEVGPILDHGCGDGQLLAELLACHPRPVDRTRVHLEDLAPEARRQAAARVRPLVGSVDADRISARDGDTFAVVLAIGVLDYYDDWAHRLAALASRATSALVVTMPRRRHLGHLSRRLWLRVHGLSICRIDVDELRSVVSPLCDEVVLVERGSTIYCALRWANTGAAAAKS